MSCIACSSLFSWQFFHSWHLCLCLNLSLKGMWVTSSNLSHKVPDIMASSSGSDGQEVGHDKYREVTLWTWNNSLNTGGFLKWVPKTMGFPSEMIILGVFWGYHYLRKHPHAKQHFECKTSSLIFPLPWDWYIYLHVNHKKQPFM